MTLPRGRIQSHPPATADMVEAAARICEEQQRQDVAQGLYEQGKAAGRCARAIRTEWPRMLEEIYERRERMMHTAPPSERITDCLT